MRNAQFLEGIGGGLSEHWVANLLTPAFVFWAGGSLAVVERIGFEKFRAFFQPLSETLQLGVLIFALLVVALSSFVMKRFDFTALRWCEGYWTKYLRPVRRYLTARQIKHRQQAAQRWQDLYSKYAAQTLTADEREDLARMEAILRYIPEQPDQVMPTRLGNILRTAELTPYLRYGLDAVVCWPYLWLVLPEQTRGDVAAAREELNTSVRLLLWGILFAVWTLWAGWALIVSVVVIVFAYGWIIDAAIVYADLLIAAFALHRFDLYAAFKVKRPTNLEEEQKLAAQLTQYLVRGYTTEALQYEQP